MFRGTAPSSSGSGHQGGPPSGAGADGPPLDPADRAAAAAVPTSTPRGSSRPIRPSMDYGSDLDEDGLDDDETLVHKAQPANAFRRAHQPRAPVTGLLSGEHLDDAGRRRRISVYDDVDEGVVERIKAGWVRRTGAAQGLVRRNEGPSSALSLAVVAAVPFLRSLHRPASHCYGAARLCPHQHVRQAARTRRPGPRVGGMLEASLRCLFSPNADKSLICRSSS